MWSQYKLHIIETGILQIESYQYNVPKISKILCLSSIHEIFSKQTVAKKIKRNHNSFVTPEIIKSHVTTKSILTITKIIGVTKK